MEKSTMTDLLKQVMQLFEDTAETVYNQMRRDVKLKIEEIADKGLTTMLEISRRIAEGKMETGKEEVKGKVEEQLREIKEMIGNNMKEWREEKEKEENKRQEAEEAITNIIEKEMKNINGKIESSEDNITAEVIDLQNKIKINLESEIERKISNILGPVERSMIKCSTKDIIYEIQSVKKKVESEMDRLIIKVVYARKEKTEETRDEIKRTITESRKEGDQGGRTDSYANITIGRRHQPIETLHSITIASENANETSEEVLQKTSTILEAEKGKVRIDRVRKSKYQKIVIGCNQRMEIEKIEEKLRKAKGLIVEKMTNKDPLVILKNVIYKMTDEEAIERLIRQNGEIFGKEEEKEIKIKFRKKTRDIERCHMILQVKPTIWNRMIKQGHLYMGMERVRVEDQSPLIQCTRCLQFGHGRKFCTESADRCSHCGGPHLRAECPDRGEPPRCCNCVHSKQDNTDHNAFSQECRTREKWEYLARSTTAYI
ncbi:unnamed protein product [Diatraea saccharalis]|uniref:Uncharacterized protein n=1 Tax=Diatraea saccharalis TaxID=40085 RepID=A0A9N9QKX5_9NEOP|nr:unnamed protein product [Diatraea saccharalis]